VASSIRPRSAVYRLALTALALALAGQAPPIRADVVNNYTGLPVFPSLRRAAMDKFTKTDTLGRWCSRFAAETSYPLDTVEEWYRKALATASETDLTHDANYNPYPGLNGIKLALGIDYVTVFRVRGQTSTSIELFRCSG
jgi:hypothetical protein